MFDEMHEARSRQVIGLEELRPCRWWDNYYLAAAPTLIGGVEVGVRRLGKQVSSSVWTLAVFTKAPSLVQHDLIPISTLSSFDGFSRYVLN